MRCRRIGVTLVVRHQDCSQGKDLRYATTAAAPLQLGRPRLLASQCVLTWPLRFISYGVLPPTDTYSPCGRIRATFQTSQPWEMFEMPLLRGTLCVASPKVQ